MEVKILYEDKDIIVVVKPAGMPSQSDNSSALDMVSYLKNYLSSSVKGVPYVAVVHRLDRPVGGIMVYAKTPQAAKDLSAQIQQNQMTKKYKAVLTGELKSEQGTLENYLLKNGKTNMSEIVSEKTPQAKYAKLNYKVLKTKTMDEKIYSLIEVELITGRHHQIRVQTSGAGAGLYGDTKYNPEFKNQRGWHPMGLFHVILHLIIQKQRKNLSLRHSRKEDLLI